MVAEFILQSETAESILEVLEILKAWNPTWNPRYFMSDYSEAELAALEIAFPGVRVYFATFIGSSHGHAGLKTTSMVCPIQKQKAYSPFSVLVRGHLQVMVM